MSAQTFREALRELVYRWSASVPTGEIVREMEAEVVLMKALEPDAKEPSDAR